MGRTILLVNGAAAGQATWPALLEHDYELLTAATGEEACAQLNTKLSMISAIVLDVATPALDGFALLRQLRASAAFQHVPIVVIAAHDRAREQAIFLGANGCVTQGDSPALLLAALRHAISLREAASASEPQWRDKLTGLLTREAFFLEAERLLCQHEAGYYVLSCFDIDNFKIINDQFGTDQGDGVLRHVAACLHHFFANVDGLTCRFMADKFAILYPAALRGSLELSQCHIETMSPANISRPIRIRIGRYLVSDLSLPVSAMYDRANLAEEFIKGRYDTYIADYDDSLRDSLFQEQQIVNEMVGALAAGQFEPWFQPQFNHSTGAMIGAEALVRWRRDGRLISPGEFIPIFERNGFIYEMDQYLWQQVCRLLRRWLDEGRSPLPVSVNISRYDIFQPDFLTVICGLTQRYDLPPDLLRLEITESAFAESSKTIVAVVNQLIERGFTVEIDDFGSGYSSLNTLKDVPASILKLDMRFLDDSGDSKRGGNILESVVRMAKWLGMTVIAEGAEEQAQADYLKSIGCYYIQGYFYAKPMPADEYEELLSASCRDADLDRLKTLDTLDNNEFWNPKSMETLIFNSYVGGACICEYHDNATELLRVNEQYARELGRLGCDSPNPAKNSLTRFLDAANKQQLLDALHTAIDTQKQSACELTLAQDGQTEYVRLTARVIARAGDRYLFYCVIVNITEQRLAVQKQLAAERRAAAAEQRLQAVLDRLDSGAAGR